ncbi:MAG: carboxypeptidase-like regulatory domain-containing protein [Marinilabiliales bacterium]|nr:carboxypeptidase-like regulatory domain-containing protein [Marinilabiliales bacterium]
MLVIPAALSGQGKIEGKVLIAGAAERLTAIPLPGANVVWAGTATGTSTNPAGYFSLRKIKGHDRLVASFVGYTL